MPLALGEIFFEAIEAIRDELCPDGSLTSAIIGIAKAWPRPCILTEAALGHKKRNSDQAQTTFGFTTAPAPTLRAVNVTINEAARLQGMQMFRNFRIPEASIISLFARSGRSVQLTPQGEIFYAESVRTLQS
jgi:hypothetical protein